jgi:hypothetical protein
MKEIDTYFLEKGEPAKSCLLFLRDFILAYDQQVTEAWRYRMPFYLYKGKRFCYVWIQKKTRLPYIGIVDGKLINHRALIQENRTRMQIFLIDPRKDIPIDTLSSILDAAIKLHKNFNEK